MSTLPPAINPIQGFFLSSLGRQLGKYVLCGAVASAAFYGTVYGLGYSLNPSFDTTLPTDVRYQRHLANNTIGFILSNTIAYLLNIKYVFKPGRHKQWKEISLFFLASGLGFFPSLFSLKIIVLKFGLNSHLATLAFGLTAASANFIIRKFIIFHK